MIRIVVPFPADLDVSSDLFSGGYVPELHPFYFKALSASMKDDTIYSC